MGKAHLSSPAERAREGGAPDTLKLIRSNRGHPPTIQAREGLALRGLVAVGKNGDAALHNLNNKILKVHASYSRLGVEWGERYDRRTCHGTCQV